MMPLLILSALIAGLYCAAKGLVFYLKEDETDSDLLKETHPCEYPYCRRHNTKPYLIADGELGNCTERTIYFCELHSLGFKD